MKRFRYFFTFSLSLLLIFSNVCFANAQKNNIIFAWDTERNIGIGHPTIQKASPLILTSSKVQENHQQSQFISSITVLPSSLSYEIEIPFKFKNGEYLAPYTAYQDKASNSGHIKSNINENIGLYFISTDKIQEEIEYSTEIKKNSLVLSLKTNKLIEPTTISIEVIFPTISTYFSNHEWIKRGKVDSISFKPTPYLLSSANYEIALLKSQDSWEKIKDLHYNDAKWSNISGLQKQYNCHYNFAKNKNEWNLEPARKNVSYFSTVRASCNPNF